MNAHFPQNELARAEAYNLGMLWLHRYLVSDWFLLVVHSFHSLSIFGAKGWNTFIRTDTGSRGRRGADDYQRKNV